MVTELASIGAGSYEFIGKHEGR